MDCYPHLRQTIVAVSPQLAALSVGGSIVFPTVILEQLKANDSSIHLDFDTASWIGAIYGFSGIPVIFLPMLMQWKGRKFGYILTCLFVIIAWLLTSTANNAAMILISECFHGLGTNSLLPVSFLSMTEMLSPKFRNMSMPIFGFIIAVGMTITGILGRYLHYKTISTVMIVPVTVAGIIGLTWPESPPWLACQGKFEKCEEAFKWLRGSNDKSKKELNELIIAQKENLRQMPIRQRMTWIEFKVKVTSRDFYIPSFHIFVLFNMLYWSGGDVILIYFIEMAEKTTQNKDAAFYASIVMYCIISIGAIITTICIKRFNSKTVLLTSTSGVIVFLISITIATFLQSIDVLAKDSIICVYLLVGFMVCNSLGLNAVVFYIGAELMPVKHRSIGGALYIIYNCGLYASTLKISPFLLRNIGMSGTFLIFSMNAIVCAWFVWRYVPSTKGRTLQELEDYYMYGHFIERSSPNEHDRGNIELIDTP